MQHTIIIAEAGVNHNGNLNLAKKMVDVADDAGADYVKFQTSIPELLLTANAEKADYQKHNTDANENQIDMIKKLMLSYDEFIELKNYCEEKKCNFLSTAFDVKSVYFLKKIGIQLWKIPSGEVTNYPYLKAISKYHQPIIMSTGMCTIQEIREALQVLVGSGANDITLLHCNTQYPTPFEDVNLKAMLTLEKEFQVKVGYSDHTLGIEIPIAATAMGATVIEKHFTLDRSWEGPDHKASLEPNELKQMVQSIRNIEVAMGDGIKTPTVSEIPNIAVARKSIVALTSIQKGEILSKENITTKRPGTGISPMHWNDVIGSVSTRDYQPDEQIEYE